MPDYNFHTLSPIDFENLVRDLLQEELQIQLESFKYGQDRGIDLRYSTDNSNQLIVQCKHYYKTGLTGLLKNLEDSEKPKVDALKPKRYIVATSVPLSPKDKDIIENTFEPFVNKPSDIYGMDDINNLLGKYPEIEKKHFKLWLSSLNILEEILHSRIVNDSNLTLERIKNKSRYYVINESFKKAVDILTEYNYCIIAGLPGIGKTMLAQMLILQFLKEGYDFINVSYDISDALSMPLKSKKRIYFYDDFLGRTSLSEKLQKNEDQRLFRFLEVLREMDSAKLILTTREYILRQAQTTYEVLNNPLFEKAQCIIDLGHYTRPIRSQILYNHLFFSSLPNQFIQEIINKGAYLTIIDHENFNPRLIEYMTDPIWIGKNQSKDYPSIFIENLKRPYLVWKEVFENQLDEVSKYLLIILLTLPYELFLEDLFKALGYFRRALGIKCNKSSFRRSIRVLDGNFISINLDQDNEIVSFHNPSIQDFLESFIANNQELYFDLIRNSIFFEQLESLLSKSSFVNPNKELSEENRISISQLINELFWVDPCRLTNLSMDKGKTFRKMRSFFNFSHRLAFVASLAQKKAFSFVSKIVQENLEEISGSIKEHSIDNFDIVKLLKHVTPLGFISNQYKENLLIIAKESLISNAYWVSSLEQILTFYELYPHMYSDTDKAEIKKKTLEIVSDYHSEDDLQHLEDELTSIKNIMENEDIPLHREVQILEERISFLEAENEDSAESALESAKNYSGATAGEITDSEIRSLFDNLKEYRGI